MFGLVVSPGNVPSRREADALHVPWFRTIVYSLTDIDRLARLGRPILATVNNQTKLVAKDWSGWDRCMRAIAKKRIKPFAVACMNEPDLYYRDGDERLNPWFAAELVRRASAILRPAGILVVAPSVAGPDWQWYLEEMANGCRDEADLFDLHPYGQVPDAWTSGGWGFGQLRSAICRAREISGRPVICSEIGIKVGDASGEWNQGQYVTRAAETITALGPDVCPYAAWFAWRDQVGAPSERGDQAFGLVAENGTRRPAFAAFAALPKEDDVDDDSRDCILDKPKGHD